MLRYTKSLLLFGMLLGFLSGCQLLKKTITDNNVEKLHYMESMDLIEQELYSEQQMREMLSVKNDSASSQTILTIWPRGPFKFSADSGFTGTADSIQLLTSNKTGAVHTEQETWRQHANLVADRKVTAKTAADGSITKKTKISAPTAFPYVVFGVVIIAAVVALTGYLMMKAR